MEEKCASCDFEMKLAYLRGLFVGVSACRRLIDKERGQGPDFMLSTVNNILKEVEMEVFLLGDGKPISRA
jgi:hypothetical protein